MLYRKRIVWREQLFVLVSMQQCLQVCMDVRDTDLALQSSANICSSEDLITGTSSEVRMVANVGQMLCLRCATQKLQSVPEARFI